MWQQDWKKTSAMSVSGGSEDEASPRFWKIWRTLALEGKPQNRSKMFGFHQAALRQRTDHSLTHRLIRVCLGPSTPAQATR